MPNIAEVLTKVYGFINQIKVCLSLNDIDGVWKNVNKLSDYLVSIEIRPTNKAPACQHLTAPFDYICVNCLETVKAE